MADSADASSQENDLHKSFDVILRNIGSGGKYQWRIFLIASFCGVFTSFQSLSSAFLAASPDFSCNVEQQPIEREFWPNTEKEFYDKFAKCDYFVPVESNDSIPLSMENKKCTSWIYDDSIYKSTVVTEWNLVCQREWLVPVVQSTFMSGVLVGAVVLSELSDMYGRRTVAVISAISFFFASVASAFSYNLIMFLILKFLVAFFTSGLYLPNFVLIMEMIGKKSRTSMGILYQLPFAVGFAILPGIAYFIRDWRYLQLAISAPSCIMFSYIWILPESPRWLLLKGRVEEAANILSRMAEVNGGSLPNKNELNKLVESIQKTPNVKRGLLGRIAEFFKSQAKLLGTPIMRRRCLIIFFAWFVTAMIYYGLAFSGGNINASVYTTVFLSGAVEIPSLLVAVWTVKKFGRRLNLTFCFVICGIACLLVLVVPKGMVWLNLTLASTGKFFDSIAFSLVYIYSAELVPTGVRNIAVGTSSMCARIGSTIAPFIVESLGKIHYAIPSSIFGVFAIAAGLLILLLPETGNMKMPETIKEVEAMKK